MTNSFLPLEKLGIERLIIHRIRAFCPTTKALSSLKKQCDQHKNNESNENYWIEALHRRPMFDGTKWNPPTTGFAPSLTVGNSSASFVSCPLNGNTPYRLARLLRQGIGVLTEAQTVTDEMDLVERQPSRDNGENSDAESFLTEFSTKMRVDPTDLREKYAKNVQPIEHTAFEVVEMQFQSEEHLKRLDDAKKTDVDSENLRRTIAYLLARSYDMEANGKTPASLKRVVSELRPMALKTLVKIDEQDRAYPINLSQSTRGFIALGPRGAVIAFAKNKDHQALRVSALNTIEILRGRHYNLIVGRTFADDAIRSVSALNEKLETLDVKDIDHALNQMMKANILYGLVVSDPGAYLLDGSTITRMAEIADQWFNLGTLREETGQKMLALHRLWQNFQDRRRIEVIDSFSKAFNSKVIKTRGAK